MALMATCDSHSLCLVFLPSHAPVPFFPNVSSSVAILPLSPPQHSSTAVMLRIQWHVEVQVHTHSPRCAQQPS